MLIRLVRMVHTRGIDSPVIQPPAVLQLMFLREEELPGVDALPVFGIEVEDIIAHAAVQQLVARSVVPRELRARIQSKRCLIIQTAVVQPRGLATHAFGRLRTRRVLSGVTGGIGTVVDEAQRMVLGQRVVRAQAEAVSMAAAAHLLVVVDEMRRAIGLLPVAGFLVGGAEAFAMSVRVKKVGREFPTVI